VSADFSAAFRRGFAAGRVGKGRPKGAAAPARGHARPRAREAAAAAAEEAVRPSPIRFGYYLDEETGETGRPLRLKSALHTVLAGVNGAGKSTRLLTELYATTSGRSLFVFDVKGTAAVQTADLRRCHGDVKIICPYPVHGLRSDRFSPLALLDPGSKYFYADARAVIDAIVDIEEGENAHWSESAADFGAALIMWECIQARREKRPASLLNVRLRGTEPDRWEPDRAKPRRQRLAAGLRLTAARMIEEGGPIIASLVAPFLREHGGEDELASIQSTFRRNTAFLLDPYIAEDLGAKGGVDFTQLRSRPTTVFAVLPPERLSANRRWTRLVLSSAMRAHFRPGPVDTLFVLDEFRATVGKLPIVADVWALVREYGMQLMPVVQSLIQLKALYGDEWENFVGQAGAVVTIGPPGDLFTADWMSRRSGNTTLLQAGFNVGDGVNAGDGANAGSGFSSTGPSSNLGSNRSYGRNTNGTFTVQQVERPAFLPQELMNLRPGHGRLWLLGMGTRSIPFFAPNYWQREAPWVPLVKPNPFYKG
jgi:type IV secretion system protein VirD4